MKALTDIPGESFGGLGLGYRPIFVKFFAMELVFYVGDPDGGGVLEDLNVFVLGRDTANPLGFLACNAQGVEVIDNFYLENDQCVNTSTPLKWFYVVATDSGVDGRVGSKGGSKHQKPFVKTTRPS